MDDDSRIDKIEAWLQGKLPAAEAAAFQSEIAADPALAEAVELHRLALQAGRHLSEQHLQQNVLMWTNSPKMDRPASFPYRNVFRALAALIVLAIIFSYFQQVQKTRKTEEREKREIARRDSIAADLQSQVQQKQTELSDLLAKGAGKDSLAQLEISRLREEIDRAEQTSRKRKNDPNAANRKIAFAHDYPSSFANIVRGGFAKGDSGSVIASAVKAYDAGDYSRAERLLKSIPPDDPRQVWVIKMLPYTLFYGEKFGEAAAAFTKLQQQDGDDTQRAEWYILLCYVAEGRDAYAQKALENIANDPRHLFQEDAKNLKSALHNQ